MSDLDNAVVSAMIKAKEIGVKMLASDCDAILQAAIASMQGEEAPKGFALVPIQPTREMERVFREEDWEWRDVLAAADSITEDDYYAVYKLSDAFIGEVIQNVAELPDRSSPDDWPEAMLVTSEELQTILLAVHEDVPAVTYPPSAAAKIAEQDARIKELEQQLEVARKDADRYRFIRMPPVGKMNVISWDSRMGKYNDCVGHALDQSIDAAIRQIGGAE